MERARDERELGLCHDTHAFLRGSTVTPLVYSPQEVAERLGCNASTVRRGIAKGEIPGRKIGGLYIVPIVAFDEWQRRLKYDAFLDDARKVRVRSAQVGMLYCEMRHRGEGTCDACGTVLTGHQRRWCSRECSERWWDNHSWSMARIAAVKSAGADQAPCARCGDIIGWDCEVNHIVPREGRGYGRGCHHHQSNLEVLCHQCHVAETTRQRRARKC